MNIGEIYAGKPDASDEVRERGYEDFVDSYIQPSGVNIEGLASTTYGTPIFVKGDKGSGKTALLYYLQDYVQRVDESACCSFIHFESEYSQADRVEFGRISTSISIDKSIASLGTQCESEYIFIWRWQLYQKIIKDNEEFNGGLFVSDDKWTRFENVIGRLNKTIKKSGMWIPAKIEISATANAQMNTYKSGITISPLDLSQRDFDKSRSYTTFVEIIKEADSYACDLKRTDTPYFVFVDELEAYRADADTFYRDLRMIRDLLFTVKWMNDLFKTGTKFLCSVRPEIIGAINRFVEPRQLHKITQGYDEQLSWSHSNTNSFHHPIIEILLKRIELAEKKCVGISLEKNELTKKWFENSVYNMHVCTYILENTWQKPRDIVRLLRAAQSGRARGFKKFNQHAFDTFMPAYSKQCYAEIREEMRALYTKTEIEDIFRCIAGYKRVFTYDEFAKRAQSICPQSTVAERPRSVLEDLYRIGVVGNVRKTDQSTRWGYKGADTFFVEEPWAIIIHPALCIELSVSKRLDRQINGDQKNRRTSTANQKFEATVYEVDNKFVRVEFIRDGTKQRGVILRKYSKYDLQRNDSVMIRLLKYNATYDDWCVQLM